MISVAGILMAVMLAACGEDPALAKFRKDIDDFCTKISQTTQISTASTQKRTMRLLSFLTAWTSWTWFSRLLQGSISQRISITLRSSRTNQACI